MNFDQSLNDLKAGMQNINKAKTEQIISELSNRSKFSQRAKIRHQNIMKHIERLKLRLNYKSNHDWSIKSSSSRNQAKQIINNLSESFKKREDYLNRFIVHVDLDAFFASCEIRDQPYLKDLPMAVGSEQMLSTSNYVARKFGVRSAMPGYIAKALCPALKILPLNFKKYQQASFEIMEILRKYYEHLESPSLDEAYLDFTHFGSKINILQKIEEMRNEIEEKTGLTASCGIAPCRYLAKIASDFNKPNGYHYIGNNEEEIRKFLDDLPVKKVKGIGQVTSTILNAFDIHSCKDIIKRKELVVSIFSKNKAQFLFSRALGFDCNVVDCRLLNKRSASNLARKSLSIERSFRAINSNNGLLIRYLEDMSSTLATDLVDDNLIAKTVTLKIKNDKFEVFSFSQTLNFYTDLRRTIFITAKYLLLSNQKKHMIRLIGIKVSNLKQNDNSMVNNMLLTNCENLKIERLKEKDIQPIKRQNSLSTDDSFKKKELMDRRCPICNNLSFENLNNELINTHIDECLNSEIIDQNKEVYRIIKNPKLDYFASKSNESFNVKMQKKE